MSGTHSEYAPSSIYLTCECPGSVNVCAGLPAEEETPESIEGDVAHWVALQLALGIVVPVGTERKGIKVDEDMLDGARLWIDNISAGGAHEVPIWIPDIHEKCWGTADHWKWDEASMTLDIEDYKYGHLYVEIFENKQLLSYASGILRAVNAPADATVRLKVVQPRCYIDSQVRTWTTTAANVRRLVAEIAEKVRIATNPNIPALCHTGSHCTFCPGRHRCTTLMRASNQIMTFSHHADSNDLEPHTIGVEAQLIRDAIKLLEARESGLATRIELFIRGGQRVPNWEMKNGRSNLAWNDNQAAIRAGDAAGVNLRKEVVPITPTQAKERKLLDAATVDSLASRPPPPQKLSFISQFSIRKILSGECS